MHQGKGAECGVGEPTGSRLGRDDPIARGRVGCDGHGRSATTSKRHQEFLSFLRHLDHGVPPEFEVHLIVDNYAPTNIPKCCTWLAQRPRYHMHYTPTYSSWLSQWNAGSASSPSAPFDAVRSPASRRWCRKLTPSYNGTIVPVAPLSGRLPLIRSCRRSHDSVRVFLGHPGELEIIPRLLASKLIISSSNGQSLLS